MTSFSLKTENMRDALAFLSPGFEKTGTHVESQYVHLELIQTVVREEEQSFLVLSTRNRYVIAKYAIILDPELIKTSKEAKIAFKATVEYEKLRNYLAILENDSSVTFKQKEGSETVSVTTPGGRYRFNSEDLAFSTAQPEVVTYGKMEYEDLHALLTQAQLFTNSERGKLEGNSVRLAYDPEAGQITATVFNSFVSSVFTKPVPKENMEAFEVHLKSNLIKKIVKQNCTAVVKVSEDGTVFGIKIPSGQVTMVSLNDVEDNSEEMQKHMELERPYSLTINKDVLTTTLSKMALFSGDTVLVEVKDDKAVFKARTARGIAGEETVTCEHVGELNLEIPIQVVSKIAGIEDTADVLRFDIDENAYSAVVRGHSKGLSYAVMFSTYGDSNEG